MTNRKAGEMTADEWFNRPNPNPKPRPSMESLLEAIAERDGYPSSFRVREELPTRPTFAARAQPRRWR